MCQTDMKNILIVLCTPDMNRPVARSCIEHIKSTDLSDAELLIVDNAYDKNFRHPLVMERFLRYAGSQSVIFLDDDVFIKDRDWIKKLLKASLASKASIVGCVHTFQSGEVNHAGVLVYKEASTELMREPVPGSGRFIYVPALSSAVMLITETENLCFDSAFNKYQHDIDICLQAWKQNKKVACTLDLEVIHIQAQYMSTKPNFRNTFAKDDSCLQEKWREYTSRALYEIPELKPYAPLAETINWEKYYNDATLLSTTDPIASAKILREITAECPYSWRVGSAYYHLYQIEKKLIDLENCVRLYPAHMSAQAELEILQNKTTVSPES